MDMSAYCDITDYAGRTELGELQKYIFEKHGAYLEVGWCRKLCGCT